MRYISAACTSPSLIVSAMTTDRLAASLAATVQHDADQACLECVEREQHDDGENRDQVLFVAAGEEGWSWEIHGVLPAHCGHQLVLLTCVEWCKAAHIIVIRVDQAL